MLTFAFLSLVLALYTMAGFFVYRYAKQEFKTALKAHVTRSIRRERKLITTLGQLTDRLDQQDAAMRQILALPNNKGLVSAPTGNFKENMENRAIQQSQKVVAVDGVQKVING